MNNVIIDNKLIKINSFTVINHSYRDKKFKTIKINNEIILKGNDVIVYDCIICNNTIKEKFAHKEKFINNKLICRNCSMKQTKLNEYGSVNGISCIKKAIKEKYGVENISQLNNVKEKVKLTNINKYNKTCNLQIQEVREKMYENGKYKNNREKYKSTCLKKYGINNTFNLEKTKKTKVEKYNNENYVNLEKRKQTNLEKYGHESVLKSNLIKEKINKNKFINIIDKLSKYVEYLSTEEDYLYREKYSKLKWKCKNCNTTFEDYYANGLTPRCPTCYPKLSGSSNREKELADWLKSLNVQIEENNRTIIKPLELDIYLLAYNLAIEFNGLYWHSELQGKDSKYHLNKTKSCQEKNIQLIHVFEDEWINKQDIVKSIIKNKLGLYDRIIYGRKCIVKEISSKEANKFYFENHIQGSCISKINLGLFYEEELVSCLSFSKPRFNKKYDWEITRFANKLNCKVHGSFGKLWKHKPEGSIITYSDKRLFTGSIYQKYMTQLKDSGTAYWYLKEGHRYSRIEFQKHKLASMLASYDSSLTEWENMQLNGYDRIWDCGNWVFEFK